MRFSLLLLGAVLFLNGSIAYKILGIFPTPVKSHTIIGDALLQGLAKAGHEVTAVTAFPGPKDLANYTHIDVSELDKTKTGEGLNFLDLQSMHVAQTLLVVYEMGLFITKFVLSHPNMKKLLASGEKFDVVIVECFVDEALFGIAQHFDAPLISMATFGAHKWNTDQVGSPSPLSYVPHSFLSYTDKMTFSQRVMNTIITFAEKIYTELVYLPKHEELYKTYFPNAKKSLDDVLRNVNFVLLNSHFSVNNPRPFVPNMVEVGGLHIKRVPNPLPENIKRVLDNAKHGVIYFSMGTNVKSNLLPADKRDALLKTFASLKQQIIWKWESDDLPGKSDNVFIQKWMPQDDILAHPNVKLFITHGGLLGTTEAIFHGVPVVGIPIFGDQDLNMARATLAEYGLTVPYKSLTQELLTTAVNEVLSNSKFTENAKLISKLYRDQPQLPLEKAIYWIEYVVRHKGAPHMHSAGQDLNFFQYHGLDVFALIFVFIFTIFWVFITCLKKICCGRKSPQKPSSKKKSN